MQKKEIINIHGKKKRYIHIGTKEIIVVRNLLF